MNYVIEKHDAELPWLGGRQTGCGASDVAAIVGLGRDRGLYAVWNEKTSPLHVESGFDELIYWGHALEDDIAERFAAEVTQAGIVGNLIEPGRYTIYRRTDKPWHCCTPDRIYRQIDGDRPVELKTAHYEQSRIWGKEVPWPYVVQCQWQQHVMDADGSFIAVLANGRDFAWHPVPRNEEIIRRLVRKVDYFWQTYVVPRVAPPVDATKATSTWLGRLYAEPTPDVFELGEEFYGVGQRWDKLTRLAGKIEKARDLLKNQIKVAMGNCSLAQLHDGSGFQWAGEPRKFTRKKKVRLPDE